MLSILHIDTELPEVALDTVLDAYDLTVNTPPLNESRMYIALLFAVLFIIYRFTACATCF